VENIKGFKTGIFYEGKNIEEFVDKEISKEINELRTDEIGQLKKMIYKMKPNGSNGSKDVKIKTKIFSEKELEMENLKLLFKNKEISTSGKMVTAFYYWHDINKIISISSTPKTMEFINGLNEFIGEEKFDKTATTSVRRYMDKMGVKQVDKRMIIPERSDSHKFRFYKTLNSCHKAKKIKHFLNINENDKILTDVNSKENVDIEQLKTDVRNNDSIIARLINNLGINEIVITDKEIRILFKSITSTLKS